MTKTELAITTLFGIAYALVVFPLNLETFIGATLGAAVYVSLVVIFGTQG